MTGRPTGPKGLTGGLSDCQSGSRNSWAVQLSTGILTDRGRYATLSGVTDETLALAPAVELHQLIVTKQISPVELTELYLRRIERLDPQLNAYLTVTPERALESARSAESTLVRGGTLGPLHGLPISVKDLEMTRGIRTTGGSLIFKDRVPEADSIVVERVRAAGAVILGKTNTPEFGLLGHTENRLGDHCRNPWNTQRTTGGSSGGAGASVASGLCALATGSDGGGSIRIPAGFCGIYGIKPTQGRVPRYAGVSAPPVANQFSQPGPMARTVRDAALLLQVLAGHDPRDPSSLRDDPPDYLAATGRGIEGLRFGWSADFGYAVVEPEVDGIAGRAARVFQELGCVVEETEMDLEEPFEPLGRLFTANVYATYGALLENRAEELCWYARDWLERGSKVTGPQYARAVGEVDILKAKFANLFQRYHLVLSPTLATTAFPVGVPPETIAGRQVDKFWGFTPFTPTINMIGATAATIPCGFSSEGLPIGLHVIGPAGEEETVLAASAAFEEARPWRDKKPAVV